MPDLTSPVVLYALLALGLTLAARARFLWGPAGVVVLTALIAAFVVQRTGFPPTADPWRWAEPVMLLALAVATLATLWGLSFGEYRRLLAGRGSQPFVPRTVRLADDRRAVILAALAIVTVGAIVLLEPRAEPSAVPWYLAAVGLWRQVLGPVAGLVVPFLGFFALAVLPLLDQGLGDDSSLPNGRLREVLTILAFWLALFLIPTVIALADSLAPESSPFAAVFWRQWLDRPMPSAPGLRELPGMVALALWFATPAWVLPRWRASRGLVGSYRRRLGDRRYALLLVLVLTLALPVFALLARELLGIGPWIGWGASVEGVTG